jgi:eukaryotic-like serine/threonine-protein kinase
MPIDAEPSLRESVESSLRSHDDAGTFLEEPAVVYCANVLNDDDNNRWIDRKIGPSRLVNKIGEGGMGIVYRGVRVDDEYRKEVTIKVARAGLSSPSLTTRFKAER